LWGCFNFSNWLRKRSTGHGWRRFCLCSRLGIRKGSSGHRWRSFLFNRFRFLSPLPFAAEETSLLLERREVVAWLRGYGNWALGLGGLFLLLK
jgi:hypothetical protein